MRLITSFSRMREPDPLLSKKTAMSVQIKLKISGTKSYGKVTGDAADLAEIARLTNQPIKAAEGKNPQHVDVPKKKLPLIVPDNEKSRR